MQGPTLPIETGIEPTGWAPGTRMDDSPVLEKSGKCKKAGMETGNHNSGCFRWTDTLSKIMLHF